MEAVLLLREGNNRHTDIKKTFTDDYMFSKMGNPMCNSLRK